MMKLQKLNTRGISHIIAPLLIVMVVAVGGTFVAVRSHAASNPYACASPRPTIQEGSTGSCVEFLQWQLTNVYHYTTHGIDGDFGPNTKAAVIDFQGHNGLTEDGIVGPLTWAKVGGVASSPPVVGQTLDKQYNYGYDTPGIGHASGVACNSGNWCSNYLSGGSSHIMWYGPYLTLPGVYSNVPVVVEYSWQNSLKAPITPTVGDTFTVDVTDHSGTTVLYRTTVAGVGDYEEYGKVYQYGFTLPNDIPISGLEIRIYNVAAPNANGDILNIIGTSLGYQN